MHKSTWPSDHALLISTHFLRFFLSISTIPTNQFKGCILIFYNLKKKQGKQNLHQCISKTGLFFFPGNIISLNLQKILFLTQITNTEKIMCTGYTQVLDKLFSTDSRRH